MSQTSEHTVSVLIIVKNRPDHLKNVLSGIEYASHAIDEVIVAHMNEAVYPLQTSLDVKQITVTSERPLPLAAARNAAAKAASGDILIFIDVDCIPDETFFETVLNEYNNDAITMADPYYLIHDPKTIDFAALRNDALPNPARASIQFGKSEKYDLFWSLGFVISRKTFMKIGGFDESFVGYGGEDTDFAFMARKLGIPLYYSRARVFHQPHPEYDPPLNWFEDIIVNSRAFYKKWGTWPMTGWLAAFEKMSLIRRSDSEITIIRPPTKQEITQTER